MEKTRKTKFREWFNRKWAEWDAQQGMRSTQQDLANYLGVSRPAVAHYASGRKTPDGENAKKIAHRFGMEVYQFTELGEPVEEIPLDQLPPELRGDLSELVERLSSALEDGADPETDEGLKALVSILEEAGFTLKAIRKSG